MFYLAWNTSVIPHQTVDRRTNQLYKSEPTNTERASSLAKLRGVEPQEKKPKLRENQEIDTEESLEESLNNGELHHDVDHNPPKSTDIIASMEASHILPGAKAHPILSMSDEEFKNTPFDQLMAPYGEAQGGGSCSKDFGNALIRRWRDTRKPNCKSSTSENSGSLHSNIDCFLVSQTRHHGNGDNICLLENVAVDLKIFGNDQFTTPVIEEYVHTRHMKQPYPPFPHGFVKADCTPDVSVWNAKFMPGWNADLTVKAFQQLDEEEAKHGKDLCSVWIDHPVLFQQRDTFANFFHDSEDFVNVFLAFSVLQWKPKDVQVMLTDLYPEGPFWDMWSRVFSHGHNALTAWDIKQQYGKTSGHVCFKQLAVGIYGPAAPTTIASWDTPCYATALVRSYSDYVIRSLNLQSLTHYAQPNPSKIITVTYMSRRATKQWPERKYCNDTNSFFLCHYWENFGQRSLGRMVRNDAEVVKALKGLENEGFGNGVIVKVQDVDYNVLTFEEQIKIDLQTDIMVGPHGAGLMHNIFMRDRARLIELFVDGSAANRHFHNLASWYGRSYTGETINNPINTRELLQLIRQAITSINANTY